MLSGPMRGREISWRLLHCGQGAGRAAGARQTGRRSSGRPGTRKAKRRRRILLGRPTQAGQQHFSSIEDCPVTSKAWRAPSLRATGRAD
jgi:hypothetical protein